MRTDLTEERTRYAQRLEKLLEDALIKVSSVVTDILGMSARAMLEALIAGERDPQLLAELARGRMRVKRAALVEALTGQFDDHHAELARLLLDQIDALTVQIDHLTARVDELLMAIPAAQAPGGDASSGDGEGTAPGDMQSATRPLPALQRLDEVTGIGLSTAQVVIAEIGLDMTRFPTAAHLVSWAKYSPRVIESGNKRRSGPIGHGNPYLKAALFEAASAAARTNTFLGARYRRLAKRCGRVKALVAIARSILVIVWHLLADPTARYRDLGAEYHDQRIDTQRKARNHIRQLQALGFAVTLTAAV
jgi:transposase